MNQTGSNSLGDLMAGLSQMAGGVDALMAKMEEVTTPEVMNSLTPEKRFEIEQLKSQARAAASKIKPDTDKAMNAATDMLRKAGINI
jgi:TolA-binding protein